MKLQVFTGMSPSALAALLLSMVSSPRQQLQTQQLLQLAAVAGCSAGGSSSSYANGGVDQQAAGFLLSSLHLELPCAMDDDGDDQEEEEEGEDYSGVGPRGRAAGGSGAVADDGCWRDGVVGGSEAGLLLEDGEYQREVRAALGGLAAVAAEVELVLLGDGHSPLLSAVARHPGLLAQRLTSLEMEAWAVDRPPRSLLPLLLIHNQHHHSRPGGLLPTAVVVVPPPLLLPWGRATSSSALTRRPLRPRLPPPPGAALPCLPALRRVLLGFRWGRVAPLLQLAQLHAPRLCEITVRSREHFDPDELGGWLGQLKAQDQLLAALAALCTRPRPVDARGRPVGLVVRLEVASSLADGMAEALQRAVDGSRGLRGWVRVRSVRI
jgi:hypothetical protein